MNRVTKEEIDEYINYPSYKVFWQFSIGRCYFVPMFFQGIMFGVERFYSGGLVSFGCVAIGFAYVPRVKIDNHDIAQK